VLQVLTVMLVIPARAAYVTTAPKTHSTISIHDKATTAAIIVNRLRLLCCRSWRC
jgi:hypothetical protein